MRATLSFFFLLFTARAFADAQSEALGWDVSPDGRLLVFVEQANASAPIYYVVRDKTKGAALGRFKATYQPDRDDRENWAFRQAMGGNAHWRDDGNYLAIDEANVRHGGTVILARRVKGKYVQIPLDARRVMEFTKQPWERGRLFVGSFLPGEKISIAVIGLLERPDAKTRERFHCAVTMDLRRNGRMLKVVGPESDP